MQLRKPLGVPIAMDLGLAGFYRTTLKNWNPKNNFFDLTKQL